MSLTSFCIMTGPAAHTISPTLPLISSACDLLSGDLALPFFLPNHITGEKLITNVSRGYIQQLFIPLDT